MTKNKYVVSHKQPIAIGKMNKRHWALLCIAFVAVALISAISTVSSVG
jgi:hypothetical protein